MKLDVTEDSQFSFGIHDTATPTPERIGEAYAERHAILFAAAPDLLDALRALLANPKPSTGFGYAPISAEAWAKKAGRYSDAVEAARAAIAKAEGRA